MASGDQLVIRAVPFGPLSSGYETAAAQSIEVIAATATFNGASAAGDFVPALAFYNPDGTLLSRTVAQSSVTAGTSAEVSFYPFVLAGSTGGAASSLTVTDGTHTVSSVTDIDFTSGATVSSGGAGVADVAISGGGGYTPNQALGIYSVNAFSLGGSTGSAVSWVYNSGTALLDLTNPAAPTVTDTGVYYVGVSYQGATFAANVALEALLFLGSTPNVQASSSAVNMNASNGPIGFVGASAPMIVGNPMQITLHNWDPSARTVAVITINVCRILEP